MIRRPTADHAQAEQIDRANDEYESTLEPKVEDFARWVADWWLPDAAARPCARTKEARTERPQR